MTQSQAVIETIDKLGGIATLNQINCHVFEVEDCVWKTKTPFASVRRIVQQTKGIYKIKPGLYALESYRKQLEQDGITVQTDKNKNSDEETRAQLDAISDALTELQGQKANTSARPEIGYEAVKKQREKAA